MPRRRRWPFAAAGLSLLLFCHSNSGTTALLQLDQVPNRITNHRSATFTYICAPLDITEDDGCNVQWSLDSAAWEPAGLAANASVMVEGLLDGVHSLSLKHDYTADGRSATESVDYTWTVDTVPPNTIVDTGPSQEGEAPRPEEADPFLFFTFHCSEDSCLYRYQFDNRVELMATWDASDGNGLEGQVSVTSMQQASGGRAGGEEGGPGVLQISVFLTAASSYSDPDDPQLMPSTVSIFDTGGVFNATAGGAGGADGIDGSSSSSGGSNSGESSAQVGSGGEEKEPLVVLVLGSPEVDSGTGNTVFSLSAEVEVPDLIGLNSSLTVEVSTNTSVLLASASLEESITSKEWLRWLYGSELPGLHMLAIAAQDEAGNVDPEPAIWTWSVDARPRTSLTSAPQALTVVDTAFFSFACALPVAEAAPSLSAHNNVSMIDSSGGDDDDVAVSSSEEAEEGGGDDDEEAVEEEDGLKDASGWEIQVGGECAYFFSLDGGNYSAVEPAAAEPAALSSWANGSSSTPLVAASSSDTLLLAGLADGVHELSVYACKANTTECDPQPLSHSWEADTSPPVTTIVSFPDKLTPSVFTFRSSKPLSRFMCKVDNGLWRQCDETSKFPLSDGEHNLVVMAVDPTGRSDPNPIAYSWEVRMLETVAEFCPPSHVPFEPAETQVLLHATFDGVFCAAAMSCQIRYVLEWEAPVPAATAGDCVAPPSPAPTAPPVPSWSLSPTTEEDEEGGSSGGDGNGSASSNEGGEGEGGATPWPTEVGSGSDDGNLLPPGQNYLSRSVVQCAEAWANCSTLEANSSYSYELPAASGASGCIKRETLVGQMRGGHGTLVMRDLAVGDYNLTLEAFNVFGVVDSSPVVCPFRVMAEGEMVNQTQIIMVRTPAKVLNSPDQAPVLFEFEVEDADTVAPSEEDGGGDLEVDSSATAAPAPAPAPVPRLSYLISGPGAGDAWEAVPAVPRAEWDALLLLAEVNNGTSSISSSVEGGGDGDGGNDSDSDAAGGSVWGLQLEGLDDGEYRLQVRDEILGDTAEYTWRADMSEPELTLDAMPQNPSHSAEAIIVLRCSKLSCGLEYQLNTDGVWHAWGATAAEVKYAHRSRAPTPSPAVAHMLGSESDSSGSSPPGSDVGESEDESEGGDATDGEGEEDEVVVSIAAWQVSSHELSFHVNVTVPKSGNFSLAARPFADPTGGIFGSTPDGVGGNDRRRRLQNSVTSSLSDKGSGNGGGGGDDYTVTVDWEVDLTRPETQVVSRPGAVTTAGVAVFQFACSLDGEEPPGGCFYQYQMMANVETDWDSLEWLPTADSVKLYEIGEGVNRIRVRAHDSDTELYDLAPAEVAWMRDATPPKLEWLWTPEKVSHLSNALFEFNCLGELPLGDVEDVEDTAVIDEEDTPGSSSSSSPSSASSSLRSPSSLSSSSSVGGASDSAVGAAALAAAYPTAFPRVLPSGCAFEASLDGADFVDVANAVSLAGLSNGDHRFSVRASDLAGNVAATSHFDWTVDTNVPDTVVVASPASATSSTMGSFRLLDTVGAQNGQGHFEYRLDPSNDNDTWAITSNITLTFEGLQDGPHVLTVRAREVKAEGGSSDQVPEVVSWTVDTVCPDTIFVVLPDVVTHLTSTVVVAEGGPDAASFEYALETTETVDAVDAAAASSAGGGGGSSVDGGVGGGSSAGGSSSKSSSSSFSSSSTTASGGGGGEAERGVVWQQGDSSGVIHLHQLKEGRHEIRVKAVDSAGNADPSPATYSWIVDRAGVYGHPSMVTDVVAEGGNKQAFVRWSAAADDGGGALTKYVVIASTAYADINVEAITIVHVTTADEALEDGDDDAPAGEVGVLPTEATVEGLTNGLVYSFQVVAANAFGYGTRSLPSNKVVTYDPADPCGLVTCGDHGSCFIQRSQSNALRGYCVCHPGYSGSDCSVVASGTDDSSVVLGAYPGSWGECDMKCGGGVRYRTVECLEYLDGIPMTTTAVANDTTCWEELGETAASRLAMTERSCRNVACLAMFLDVSMRLRAFYDDACFTVAAQDAFLSGFAAEVAHALNIKVELVIDLNAFHTDRHNEMEVRFIIAPGQTGADQPIENLREQLLLQAASETSSFRSRGTWTRKLIPDSVEVSQGTYELPPLNVTGIASDLVLMLMVVGTSCLGVAVYGACSSKKRNKWETVYDGEYGRGGQQFSGAPPDGEGARGDPYMDGNNSSRFDGNGGGVGGSGSADPNTTGGGGGRGGCVRRNRWFDIEDDSEDYDSDDDDEWDEEDENSPFFGRCALRSLLCGDDNDEDEETPCKRKGGGAGVGDDDGGRGAGEPGGSKGTGGGGLDGFGCAGERGQSGGASGGVPRGENTPPAAAVVPAIDRSRVDLDKVPLPLTGKSRPMPPLSGEAILHRRRGWGFGGGGGNARDEEDDDGGTVVRARGMVGGGSRGRGGGAGVAGDQSFGVQRPGRQAMV